MVTAAEMLLIVGARVSARSIVRFATLLADESFPAISRKNPTPISKPSSVPVASDPPKPAKGSKAAIPSELKTMLSVSALVSSVALVT